MDKQLIEQASSMLAQLAADPPICSSSDIKIKNITFDKNMLVLEKNALFSRYSQI